MTSIKSSNEKKKQPESKEDLWEEIYRNATVDREKASMLITNLWKEITTDPEKHMLYSTSMVKYLERMQKGNDQLVKLAELMQKSSPAEEESVDLDSIYTSITEDKKGF